MNIKEIRTFIPSKDYEISKSFYTALGFSSQAAGDELTVFTKHDCTFFLQKYYNKEFAENLMLQLIVSDINEVVTLLSKTDFTNVKHSEINYENWGKVIYLWGPSGELWHISELSS